MTTLETSSYIGSDIAQFAKDGDRPPRSAKFVATIDRDGYAIESYWLATTRDRRGWVLWATAHDVDIGKMYARLAWGEPYSGVPAHQAAAALLRRVWLDEIGLYWYRGPCLSVDQAGLLTAEDIRSIEASLEGVTKSSQP